MIQHPVSHLTSNYRRNKNSNNYKVLDLSNYEHIRIHEILRLVELWRDIDTAEGFTLDKIGKNVLELREGRNDESFRKAIKIKIRGNLSAGTIEDLNIIAEILFRANFVSLSETWYQEEYGFEPAAVAIHLHYVVEQDASFWRDINFINSIMAGGAGLYIRQTTGYDIFTYVANTTCMWIKEYIICDDEPLNINTPSYTATAPSYEATLHIIADN